MAELNLIFQSEPNILWALPDHFVPLTGSAFSGHADHHGEHRGEQHILLEAFCTRFYSSFCNIISMSMKTMSP